MKNTIYQIDIFQNKRYNYRASIKTRLIKEKTDRYDSCKETFRRRAVALQGRLTKQMTCIAVFSQKGFLEMPYIKFKFVALTIKSYGGALCLQNGTIYSAAVFC